MDNEHLARQIHEAMQKSHDLEGERISKSVQEAVENIIRDGVEFRAMQQVLFRWLNEHGYAVTEKPVIDNHYAAQHSDGRPLEGQWQWPTYHEMLADLLARIDAQGGVS